LEAEVARGKVRPKERGPETDGAAGAAPSAEASAERPRRADEGADDSAARAAARGEVRRGGAETEGTDGRDSRASRLEEDAGSAASRAPRAPEARRAQESADAGQEFAAPPARQARVVTEFGGLFYLINVGLFLGLYGDFTTPLRPGIALPIWDFVAALGLRLCGVRVKEDGVWPLLTGLAGRVEGEPLGSGFEPPDVWRVPPEWLKPFEGLGAWEWTDARSRLRVRHPGGFHVIDVPLALEGAARQLEDEMRTYAHLSATLRRASLQPAATRHASSRRGESDDANTRARLSEASTDEGSATDEGGAADGAVVADGVAAEKRSAAGGAVVADEAEALKRWLDWLTPYVKARLSLALGAGGVEAARTLCEARAAVRLTGTHLDVTFLLARLAIEVRVAGLDRNPGWVPAAGRYVAFHYE
jgi:hypothetical protein